MNRILSTSPNLISLDCLRSLVLGCLQLWQVGKTDPSESGIQGIMTGSRRNHSTESVRAYGGNRTLFAQPKRNTSSGRYRLAVPN